MIATNNGALGGLPVEPSGGTALSAWESPGAADGGPLVVVDAALLVKLLLPEALSEHVQQFFTDAASAGRSVLVCPSVPIEVASVLHDRLRREEITLAEADTALRLLEDLGVVPYEPPRFATAVVAFARQHRLRSLHNGQSATLAQLIGCECWTGHQTLYDAIAPRVPWLRWIGDYERHPEASPT